MKASPKLWVEYVDNDYQKENVGLVQVLQGSIDTPILHDLLIHHLTYLDGVIKTSVTLSVSSIPQNS